MEIKEMNIFEKLSNITNEIETVKKNMTVGTGKNAYKAVGEAAILNAVKDLEYKYRVYSYPVSREVLESSMFTTTNDYGDKNNIFSRIKTTYRFVNIDKPEDYIETITFAEGIDNQDKGSGKAMTYSDKYALMKSYKIETGDDPEKNYSEPSYKKPEPKIDKKNIDLVKELVTKYAEIKNGNADELLKYYLNKYKVKSVEDLTYTAGVMIGKELSNLIERSTKQ